jgi:hypothetical protein
MEGGALRRRAKGCERRCRARGARPSIYIVALLLSLASASAQKAFAERKSASSISTARSDLRQRVTFPEASQKQRRKTYSAW